MIYMISPEWVSTNRISKLHTDTACHDQPFKTYLTFQPICSAPPSSLLILYIPRFPHTEWSKHTTKLQDILFKCTNYHDTHYYLYLSSNIQLNHWIKVWIVLAPAILKKAAISAIPNPNEKGFSVRTERDARYLTKKINFLFSLVPAFHIIYMHKICWLGHSQILAIWSIPDWTDSSEVSLQHCHWLW